MKFSMSAMPINRAKSGINFDPTDPRKKEVLRRWNKAITPLLKNYYGSGGDLNVDEAREVIPITRELFILHPQEGILRGYFGNMISHCEVENRTRQLQIGVCKIIENPDFSPDVTKRYTIADMITGYSVAESVKCYYRLYAGNILNKKVLVQGYGNVGGAADYFLAKAGCKIVSIV